MPFFLLAIKQKKRHCPSSCCKNALKLSRISHEKTKRLRIDVGISSSACKAKYFKKSNSCTVQRRNCPILDQILQFTPPSNRRRKEVNHFQLRRSFSNIYYIMFQDELSSHVIRLGGIYA